MVDEESNKSSKKLGNTLLDGREEKFELFATTAAAAAFLTHYFGSDITYLTKKAVHPFTNEYSNAVKTLKDFSQDLQHSETSFVIGSWFLDDYAQQVSDLHGIITSADTSIKFPPGEGKIKTLMHHHFLQLDEYLEEVMPDWFRDFNDWVTLRSVKPYLGEDGRSDEEILEDVRKDLLVTKKSYQEAMEFYEHEMENYQVIQKLVDDVNAAKEKLGTDGISIEEQLNQGLAQLNDAEISSDSLASYNTSIGKLEVLSEQDYTLAYTVANALPLALIGVLAVKGARRMLLPNKVDDYIAKAFTYPFKVIGNVFSWRSKSDKEKEGE